MGSFFSVKKLPIYLFLFFGVFLIFPSEKRGVLVVFLILSSIISLLINKKSGFLDKTLFINSSLYLTYSISALIAIEASGYKRFETTLSILLMPLVFAVLRNNNKSIFSHKNLIRLSCLFIFSATILSIIIYSYFMYLGYFSSEVTFGYCISKLDRKLFLLNDHPIYISIGLSIAVLLSSFLYKHFKRNRLKATLIVFVDFFLIITIFFLSRKGVIIALMSSLIALYIAQRNLSFKTLIFGLLILVSSIVLIISIPTTQKRIAEVFNTKTYNSEDETNSTNNRLQVYKCAWKLIKEKPIIGYGLGYDRIQLNDCYKKNLFYLFEHKYNTHNQYLSILMKTGIIGFIIFILFLAYNVNLSLINRDWLFFSILIFFILILLFENILERQNGIILFSFLINYFAYRNKLSVK